MFCNFIIKIENKNKIKKIIKSTINKKRYETLYMNSDNERRVDMKVEIVVDHSPLL